MILLDGKELARQIKEEIKAEVAAILDADQRGPHLAAILVGEDPASETYVSSKERSSREVGIISSVYKFSASVSEKDLLETVDFLNNDPDIDGFIVQLPLPKHIDVDKVISSIHPDKDIDGFHPENMGKLTMGIEGLVPATPAGIMEMLRRYNIETEGKHCVVLGRSNIVGTPVALLMSRKGNPGNATVTLCHSKTKNIKEICQSADILIAAIGQQEFVTADMVKQDAVVIDVGIHRVPTTETKSGYKIVGDVAFDEVSKKCSYITPVPGGVGAMTIVSLLQNTMKAYKNHIQ
ncbi:MAG: bifunctional methylenetetrahydrofolate dehydrogenase/methenyltetrahydrofolate cyclohydrolase FolD [Bacteroidales bacterium]|jgi:methylenetetrahydrofolate dehydrogenase (NADP+)/methenyltetrahydrofolate cyclohydrolase|nr:bifunctional methylenetetrahydrofolate dehydrogenase/methenyltetrahydrofolate cyclohydrolase FolD [Bacteroidales bacterium]